jgi:hypothetical protein
MPTPIGTRAVGEDATTGEINFTTEHAEFDLRTRGKTLYVIPAGGEEFTSVVVEGMLPGEVWVKAVGLDGEALTIDTSQAATYILGADYAGLRVVTTGGSDYVAEVEADPDAIPDPIVGSPEILASTVDAGII